MSGGKDGPEDQTNPSDDESESTDAEAAASTTNGDVPSQQGNSSDGNGSLEQEKKESLEIESGGSVEYQGSELVVRSDAGEEVKVNRSAGELKSKILSTEEGDVNIETDTHEVTIKSGAKIKIWQAVKDAELLSGSSSSGYCFDRNSVSLSAISFWYNIVLGIGIAGALAVLILMLWLDNSQRQSITVAAVPALAAIVFYFFSMQNTVLSFAVDFSMDGQDARANKLKWASEHIARSGMGVLVSMAVMGMSAFGWLLGDNNLPVPCLPTQMNYILAYGALGFSFSLFILSVFYYGKYHHWFRIVKNEVQYSSSVSDKNWAPPKSLFNWLCPRLLLSGGIAFLSGLLYVAFALYFA